MAGPKMNYPRMDTAAQNQRAALEMKRRGMKLDDIVAAGLYSSRGAASVAIKSAMERSRREMFVEAELYRAESLDRLESLLNACWDQAIRGSKDHIAEARRIISDIGDLTGAKAPIKFEIGEGDVDRLLASIDARLEQLDPGRAGTLEGEIVPGEIEAGPAGADGEG